MNAPGGPPAPAAFASRYLLARYGSGGVVVDLESGNYYRVNRTAALVCDALSREPDRIAAATSIAADLRIDAREAESVLDEVVAGLNGAGRRGEIQGSYHFFPTPGGYELRHGAARVLELDADGSSVRIAPGAPPTTPPQMELYVRALAPKLLFQNQISVLHASCCALGAVGGRLVAFAGVSGAGKTTTVRAFRDAGATLISEDLVVLSPDRTSAAVLTEGEQRIHAWADTIARRLLDHPDRPLSTTALTQQAVRGPTVRLHSILFIDRSRRDGTEFRDDPVEAPDALAELLRHDFLGDEVGTWRRFFESAVALLDQIDARLFCAPARLDGLAAAAGRYISRTAS
jgi:hypothetical protein